MNPLLYVLLIYVVIVCIVSIVLARRTFTRYLGPELGLSEYRKRLPFLIGVVSVIILTAGISLFLIQAPIPHSIGQVISLLVGLAALSIIPIHLFLVQRLGKMILRVPWSKRNTLWLAGTLFVLLSTLGTVVAERGLTLVGFCFLCCLCVSTYFSEVSRVQFREGGIIARDDILPWIKIKTYTWISHSNHCVLKLETRSKGPWRTQLLPVPPALQDTISEVLQKHLPS